MSALTKIFVMLLVVMSLMLSAGLIVFVNRQENYQGLLKEAIQKKNQAIAEQTAGAQNLIAANVEKDRLANELNSQIQIAKNENGTLNAQIAQLNGQLNEKDQTIAQLTASNTSINAALGVATADIKARQDGYNTLVVANDKVQKENVASGNRITELTNANDILTRQGRYSQEQLTQLQQANNLLSEILRKYNISPTGQTLPPGGAINQVPNVNINGVVRDFKNINGVPFATISLGSADAVTRGMKFNVIDPGQNHFLGYFTVDTVGVHEATGRLELVPGVDSVRPNISEVRTQL